MPRGTAHSKARNSTHFGSACKQLTELLQIARLSTSLTPKRLWSPFGDKGPRSIVAFRHATPLRCAARLRRTRHSTARVESFPPLPLRPPAAKYKVCTVLLKSDLDFRKLLRRRAL